MGKLFITCATLFFSVSLFAQHKLIEKANEAYKYKQYAEAANLYEQALNEMDSESKRNLSLKTKLAYCYRMNNRLEEAESLYAELVTNPRAKSETYLYYGEALMSNEKYDEAKTWFLNYQKIEPDDPKAALMVANCDKIKEIEPYFPYLDIQEFPYNSAADDNAPVAWQNGIVFSSDREQGIRLMKEKSPWTGRDYLDLYFSRIHEDGSFDEPRQFSSKISSVNKNTGNASFSTDGQEVYFTQNDDVLNKQQTYNLQLYRSQANGRGGWKKADKLSFCSPNYNFMHPAISPDGQWLFFASDRKGQGGTDLWMAQRKGDDWGKLENLGEMINTSANEGFPFMDAEGKLYFCSKGHPGYGGFDIFVTEKDETGAWTPPLNLGKPVNTPLDDISIYLYEDRMGGMFTSSRNGGDDDIYLFEVLDEPPAEPMTTKSSHINTKPGLLIDKPQINTNSQPEAKTEMAATGKSPKEDENVKPENKGFAIQVPESVKKKDPEPETEQEPVFFEMPEKDERVQVKNTSTDSIQPPATVEEPKNPSFRDFLERAARTELRTGDVYRLEEARFDEGVWQLTPRITKELDQLVSILRRYPLLQVEIRAHTEALGPDEVNLELSKNRAATAIDYIEKEGIDRSRLSGIGYGESMLLNHCEDGVTCSKEEHLFNQRLEVKVLVSNE